MTGRSVGSLIIFLVVNMVFAGCQIVVEKTPILATESSGDGSYGGLAVSNTPQPAETLSVANTPIFKVSKVTALRSLYVRFRGDYGSPVVGVLYAGESVDLLGDCNRGGWIRIENEKGLSGWVNADYLDGGCNE